MQVSTQHLVIEIEEGENEIAYLRRVIRKLMAINSSTLALVTKLAGDATNATQLLTEAGAKITDLEAQVANANADDPALDTTLQNAIDALDSAMSALQAILNPPPAA